ncbi:MAG: adenylate/guanylate cyclase domain-containing protein [Actinomycetota bacterium]
MDTLTREEVASRAGVTPETVDRLVELKVLADPAGAGGFRPGDVYRIRILTACEAAGMRAEAVAGLMADGTVPMGFADLRHYRWSALGTKTYRELAKESNVEPDLLIDVVAAGIGVRPSADDRVREDDTDIARLAGLVAPFLGGDVLIRSARVYSDAVRRIVEAEATLFDTYFVNAFVKQGMTFQQAIDLANEISAQTTPLQEDLLLTMYRRQQEHRWSDYVVEAIERLLEERGLFERPARPPAFAFVDLAGYTALTEERGDEVVAKVATDLAGMVDGVARAHAGRAVKWLGDGVMVYFKDPGDAVNGVLEIVEQAPAVGLPAHAGIAAGPVVTQDGDYFGRTVNMAARIAAHAEAGQTLVSSDVATLADGRARFRKLEVVNLKGFAQPVEVFEALPRA